ncbi:paraquat-inducible protein A [Vibrio rumoiensis]|uniref:Paraquat-inducible protein A n=1 Tax=Vibrio rumoiensis 1S-45 TaxID=1188252 RepID=A0A1E5E0V8_9VIBR|nr:paraquat-inducible protein A [Vibrio rumoiensis]OEF24095.1 paraquat-inducible protein A [Vibrio rumoiensis 1S-45]
MSTFSEKDHRAQADPKHLHCTPLAQPPQPVVICSGCDLKVKTGGLPNGNNAHCPRCDTQLYRSKEMNINSNLILAISGLFFFIPSLFLPFVTIRLINVNFSADLITGSYSLMKEGFFLLGLIVVFCSAVTPFLAFGSILTTHWALKKKNFFIFQLSLSAYQKLKHWLMLDVFLLSIAVAFFKLQEYSTINPKMGLACIVLSQVIAIALVSKVSVRRYWEIWKTAEDFKFSDVDVHCDHCHLSQPATNTCLRCEHTITTRKPLSIQKTWAFLISASIFLIPANFLDISVIFSNGKRYEDTIFSGVVSLVKTNMMEIAIVIFVASILVPIAKVVGLAYILICIQFKTLDDHYQRMKLFQFVKWIGKWSILDLFVISITIALVDRDQILDFSPGPAALAFAGVVVFTMFAAESFDSRLIWTNYPTTNNKNEPNYEK